MPILPFFLGSLNMCIVHIHACINYFLHDMHSGIINICLCSFVSLPIADHEPLNVAIPHTNIAKVAGNIRQHLIVATRLEYYNKR